MVADYVIKFLFDILDFQKSPQSEAFNLMFNNLDTFWIFKMQLADFIKYQSPYKIKAQKLLH